MVGVEGTLYWLSVDCFPHGESSRIVSVFSLIVVSSDRHYLSDTMMLRNEGEVKDL